MLKPPQQVDMNEWFVLASIVLLIVCFWIVPKAMPRGMILSTLLLFAVFAFTADILIGVDFPINFYTITDTGNLEALDVLIYSINYPLYGYFFSHFVVKLRRTASLLWFIPFWSLLTGAIEWVSVMFNVFTYQKGWTVWYSMLLYLFVFSLGAMATKLFTRFWTNAASSAYAKRPTSR